MNPERFLNLSNKQGSITALALIFGSFFILIFTGLAGFISTQLNQSKQKAALYEALNVAEAGANYARWRLAHEPDNFNFSGTYDYQDPEGGTVGHYTLEITAPGACSTITQINSTGWTLDYPDNKRTVQIKFGRPSLAQYSFLTNSNAWFGEDEELRGPFHSNGGIRMDGQQNSISTSATSTYLCGQNHGCSPAQNKPGIWGTGNGNAEGLWQFPVPAIDFNAITLDLSNLKTEAQNGGYYFGPSGSFGYHIRFKNNGTFDLYRVTRLKSSVYGCNTDNVCGWEQNDIDRETLLQNYALAENQCTGQNLIFIEDGKVWVDGTTREKATVVAARFPDNPTTNASIIVPSNLSRADPRDTLVALIAQKNILVPHNSPNVMEIQAVMIAQKGAVQRYYYSGNTKNRIMVRGAIATNKVWTWSWVNDSGTVISGYRDTETYYEPSLIYDPPPFFPGAGEQQFISWQEAQ